MAINEERTYILFDCRKRRPIPLTVNNVRKVIPFEKGDRIIQWKHPNRIKPISINIPPDARTMIEYLVDGQDGPKHKVLFIATPANANSYPEVDPFKAPSPNMTPAQVRALHEEPHFILAAREALRIRAFLVSAKEVGQQRGFSVTTIIGRLLRYVALGTKSGPRPA